MRFVAGLLTTVGVVSLLSAMATAQDLEPRAYSASPIGTRFAGVYFGRSSGDITFDPSIPITDVKATFYTPALGLGTTFGLFGRQALITTGLPYAWGNVSGNVADQRGSVYRSGLVDIRTRLSVNLRGNPAQTPAEFARRKHRDFIVGTSVTVVAPSGQYDNTKLINIGANRWAFKPEVGLSWPVKKLDLDVYAAVWLFTGNASFYPGQADRTQSSLTALQGHASYTVRRGLWVAFDATWYGGGVTRVNGGAPTQRQANTRIGTTLSIPVGRQQSIKIAYSTGVSGTIGSKFSTVSGGWQYVWFKR